MMWQHMMCSVGNKTDKILFLGDKYTSFVNVKIPAPHPIAAIRVIKSDKDQFH